MRDKNLRKAYNYITKIVDDGRFMKFDVRLLLMSFLIEYLTMKQMTLTTASRQQHQTTADLLVNDVTVECSFSHSEGTNLPDGEDSKWSSTGFVVYDLHFGDKVSQDERNIRLSVFYVLWMDGSARY